MSWQWYNECDRTAAARVAQQMHVNIAVVEAGASGNIIGDRKPPRWDIRIEGSYLRSRIQHDCATHAVQILFQQRLQWQDKAVVSTLTRAPSVKTAAALSSGWSAASKPASCSGTLSRSANAVTCKLVCA